MIMLKETTVMLKETTDTIRKQLNTWPKYKSPPAGLYQAAMAAVQAELIDWYLMHHEGNQLKAAKAMGINRNTLRKYIRDNKIDVRM